jgi:ABC-type antimicrobial peptide transport system permease subunit
MLLIGAFAALALAIGSIGIYGVVSCSVRRRTHEIGIRMALGAGQGRILSMVLSNGLKLIAVGIVIGLLASAALTRLIASELWGSRHHSRTLTSIHCQCHRREAALRRPKKRTTRIPEGG